MKIKKDILEKIIQDSIDNLECDNWNLTEKFAIQIEKGIEVQIQITRDDDELCGDIIEEYSQAL